MSYPKLTPIIAKEATEPRYLEDRFADIITPLDFGAKGDGTTDDTAVFASIDEAYPDGGKYINLAGLTYVLVRNITKGTVTVNEEDVSVIETATDLPIYKQKYFNGRFKIITRDVTDPDSPQDVSTSNVPCQYSISKIGHRLVALGAHAGENFLPLEYPPQPIKIDGEEHDFDDATNPLNLASGGDDVVCIGQDAGKSMFNTKNSIAIGRNALTSLVSGGHNIAIGVDSLHFCNRTPTKALSVANKDSTRNIAIGGNTGFYITTGNRNVMIGRDCGSAITTGTRNIVIGNGAMMGTAEPSNSTTARIGDLLTPITGNGNVVLGCAATQWMNGGYNVILGYEAGYNLKQVTNFIAIGHDVARGVQLGYSPFGTNYVYFYEGNKEYTSATYTVSSEVVTVTTTTSIASNIAVGDKVFLSYTTGSAGDASNNDPNWAEVVTVASSSFTVVYENCSNGSGDCHLFGVSKTGTTYTATEAENVFIGAYVGSKPCTPVGATLVGLRAGESAPSYSTGLGAYALQNATGIQNVAIGYNVLNKVTNKNNIGIGYRALENLTDGENNVAIGANALRYVFDELDNPSSDPFDEYTNCVGIGAFTRVSGSNQIQLGTQDSVTYVYGTVHTRSDLRDKTDIRDTTLGLNFIKALHPVDFRWDYRDSYIDYVNEVGTDEEVPVAREKDGSRKRTRFHHGLIAQEVKDVLDEQNIDFGGYQDHKVNGGKDVLTLGYEEFIAPMIKAIQELNNKVEQLEERINQLTNPIS